MRPCAYGLVMDNAGRIAVARSRDGVFLPGGGIEAGETPETALEREAIEECGWTIRVGACIALATQLTPSFEKPSTFFAIDVLHSTGAGLEPGHETLWLHPDEAAATLMHESHAWAVQQFISLARPRASTPVPRRIVGFHQDDEGHWVADLECGHAQHVRHDPPWQVRPWVLTAEGRESFVGVTLGCIHCTHATTFAAGPPATPS